MHARTHACLTACLTAIHARVTRVRGHRHAPPRVSADEPFDYYRAPATSLFTIAWLAALLTADGCMVNGCGKEKLLESFKTRTRETCMRDHGENTLPTQQCNQVFRCCARTKLQPTEWGEQAGAERLDVLACNTDGLPMPPPCRLIWGMQPAVRKLFSWLTRLSKWL